jgi:hypothetical protein
MDGLGFQSLIGILLNLKSGGRVEDNAGLQSTFSIPGRDSLIFLRELAGCPCLHLHYTRGGFARIQHLHLTSRNTTSKGKGIGDVS